MIAFSYVNNVVPGSPAAKAGLMSGSILLGMNGADVKASSIAEIVEIMSCCGLKLNVHVELPVIRALVAGDELKKVRGGKTYTRVFRIASEGGSLCWDSRHRAPSESIILMPFIRSIRSALSLFTCLVC